MTSGVDIRTRSFQFAKSVVRICELLFSSGVAGRLVSRQLLAAGTSVGANLEEAEGSHSHADFVARCNIARREARETLYWLRLADECGLLPHDRLAVAIREADELTAVITAIVKSARRRSPRR